METYAEPDGTFLVIVLTARSYRTRAEIHFEHAAAEEATQVADRAAGAKHKQHKRDVSDVSFQYTD